MKFVIGWSIFLVAFLIFGCIKFALTKNSEEVVIHLPNWLFYSGVAFVILPGAATIYLADISSGWLSGILLSILGVAMMLCQLNQKTIELYEDRFLYQTMFGRKKLYSFSDIIGMQGTVKGNNYYLLMNDGGKMYIDSSTVKDPHFMNKIKAALQEQGVECEFV